MSASDFRAVLAKVSYSHGVREVFTAFVRLAACAVAAGTREAEYAEESARWKREELQGFVDAFAALVDEMETQPFADILGPYYMETAQSQKGAQRGGEFHTPQHLCEVMAAMTWGDGSACPKDGPIRVIEPACGAGATILAFAKVVPPEVRRRLRVTATDVSRIACDMAFVNTTLWGVPCRIIHGNSLSLETWGSWPNIHLVCPWLLQTHGEDTPQAVHVGPVGQQELFPVGAA